MEWTTKINKMNATNAHDDVKWEHISVSNEKMEVFKEDFINVKTTNMFIWFTSTQLVHEKMQVTNLRFSLDYLSTMLSIESN